ncbi:hypothetical protein, partial [Microcoleus sp.]|uniref:hypothetical protein n=1 Tax=Microcoleus sp. TaxID=44472 RepID=UPI00403E6F28
GFGLAIGLFKHFNSRFDIFNSRFYQILGTITYYLGWRFPTLREPLREDSFARAHLDRNLKQVKVKASQQFQIFANLIECLTGFVK